MTVSLKTNGKNRTKWRWRPVSSCWPPPLHFTPSSEPGSNTTPPSLWLLHQIADQQKHPGAWRQSLTLARTTAAAVRTVPCLGCGINGSGYAIRDGISCVGSAMRFEWDHAVFPNEGGFAPFRRESCKEPIRKNPQKLYWPGGGLTLGYRSRIRALIVSFLSHCKLPPPYFP